MTIVETMWPETRPRAELHDEVNRLSQERITAHAAMVELRSVGDLENNDDYHRAVRVVEMLDAQNGAAQCWASVVIDLNEVSRSG